MYDQTEDRSINPSCEAFEYGPVDAPDDSTLASIHTHVEHDGPRQGLSEFKVEGSTMSSLSTIVPDVKVDKPRSATGRDTKADK
jgi:hypothetical protein